MSCVTYWDEDDRLVIRTSTQVPFHVRRMLAPVLGLPVKRIRVIKPRIGGGFGGKQEVLMEDVAAHLTIATKRPSSTNTPRRGIHRGAFTSPDARQDEDGREERWDHHRQRDVRVVRHRRVRLSCVDRHGQHRSQGDGAVCRRW
jgi:CO/xanthine dehydrogenase Mo-binding subunit